VARAKPARLVKMAELAELSGVPGPTIKHYLREGLLSTARRTSRNMAYYDARLADRVRVIKELQAERFLPLRVIGDLLEPSPSAALRADLDRDARRRLGELAPGVQAQLARAGAAAGAMTRAEVLTAMPITAAELDWLAEQDIVVPAAGRGTGAEAEAVYGGVELALLGILADLRRAGLGEVFPLSLVEPYLAAVRGLVRLEIDLFRRRVMDAGVALPRPLPDVAREMVELGERLVVALRARLLPGELEALGRR
jgi:DNA-binding transcriptional MerR regulator